MSPLCPEADIWACLQHVCFVPKPKIVKIYSITSLARMSRIGLCPVGLGPLGPLARARQIAARAACARAMVGPWPVARRWRRAVGPFLRVCSSPKRRLADKHPEQEEV
jgi:hypothetical protein